MPVWETENLTSEIPASVPSSVGERNKYIRISSNVNSKVFPVTVYGLFRGVYISDINIL